MLDGGAPVIDEFCAPMVRLVFDLADQGMTDAHIARTLNADGHRTRSGRPSVRRAVQSIVTNPFYAGRIAYKRGTADERIVNGHIPP